MDSNTVSPVVGHNDDNDERKTSTGRATPGSGHGHARTSAESGNIEVDATSDVASDNRHSKATLWRSFCQACWLVLTHSWVNVLLVFVPAGIIVKILPGIHGGIIFALNCVAVIPLAGMLAFATESVASEMGDALGALMNVTFGNAVELIIFIALTKNQIRIVQASILGSILANLLLILGMGFFLGGMRYREQLYNSTVTQMSACLLSLSVISLMLPTAFHASFSDNHRADEESLKISRGTSVILLLVYLVFIVFQLKSHAYLYESTPQELVDAEATPGPAAAWLDHSRTHDNSDTNDSDSSSQSTRTSSTRSGSSRHSRETVAQRLKKALRGGKNMTSNLMSSAGSNQFSETARPSVETVTGANKEEPHSGHEQPNEQTLAHMASMETCVEPTDGDGDGNALDCTLTKTRSRSRSHRYRNRSQRRRHRRRAETVESEYDEVEVGRQVTIAEEPMPSSPRRALQNLKGSVRNMTPTLFPPRLEQDSAAAGAGARDSQHGPAGAGARLERAHSMPARLTDAQAQRRAPGGFYPNRCSVISAIHDEGHHSAPTKGHQHLSRRSAIILLLASTGLVALCAEFLISSIEEVTESSTLGEIFIGLIVLPIVGNAAEHITAITVAMKNKMDLAIGVAIGSSIQVALLITPLVVILGWALDKHMSLYFTLFETICLFGSTFIVNFLVLDGRSNYMEGALLCAVYVIIAVVAFFYPAMEDSSPLGNGEETLEFLRM